MCNSEVQLCHSWSEIDIKDLLIWSYKTVSLSYKLYTICCHNLLVCFCCCLKRMSHEFLCFFSRNTDTRYVYFLFTQEKFKCPAFSSLDHAVVSFTNNFKGSWIKYNILNMSIRSQIAQEYSEDWLKRTISQGKSFLSLVQPDCIPSNR